MERGAKRGGERDTEMVIVSIKRPQMRAKTKITQYFQLVQENH